MVISPGESVVAERTCGPQVVPADQVPSSGDGGERVPCHPDLEDCGEKDVYYSEVPTAATSRQTHDRPVMVQGAHTREADIIQNVTRNSAT